MGITVNIDFCVTQKDKSYTVDNDTLQASLIRLADNKDYPWVDIAKALGELLAGYRTVLHGASFDGRNFANDAGAQTVIEPTY
jgi:uncharacterized protein (DUF2252 family)